MFRNDGPIVEIDWYEVPEDAPVLPYDSALSSLDGTSEQLWQFMDNMGEVPWEPRPYNGLVAPAGTPNGHICGTEEDFAKGGEYDPDAPPVEVNEFGLPLCCEPAQILKGGGAGGGLPYMDYPRRPSGGGAGGGVPAVFYPFTFLVVGGGAGGGVPRADDGTLRYVVGGSAGGGVPVVAGFASRAVVGGGAGGGYPLVSVGPRLVVAGGGGGGGLPSATVITPRSVVGGGAGGGVPLVAVTPIYEVVGGGAGGGVPSEEVVTPVEPGTACVTAGLLPFATPAPFTGSSGQERWWKFPVTDLVNPRQVTVTLSSGSIVWVVLRGTCTGNTVVEFVIGADTVTVPATGSPYQVLVQFFDTGVYSATIEQYT